MNPDEIEACWKDPRNRKWGFYYCKADPRVIVPKSIPWMGWTINAARPSALPVLGLLLAILAAPAFLAAGVGAAPGPVLGLLAVSVAVVCGLSAHLASPPALESDRRAARLASAALRPDYFSECGCVDIGLFCFQ